MPLYEAQCNSCKTVHQYVKPVSEYLVTPICCGLPTKKVIFTAPAGYADIPDYISPVSGKLISGRKARHEDMVANNCRPWEGMDVERRESLKIQRETEAKWEKQAEEAAGQAWGQISQESRDILSQAQ